MNKLEINGRTFRDLDAYNAAKRDLANIEKMRNRIDMNDIDAVIKLKDDLWDGKFRFETILGDDFIDELEDYIKNFNKLESGPKEVNKTDNTINNIKNIDDNNEKRKTNIRKTDFNSLDDDMKKEIIRHLKKREKIRKLILLSLGFVALLCISYLCFYFFYYAKNDLEYKELASLVDEEALPTEYSVTIVEEDKTKPKVLKKYETLFKKNHSIVGWLKIENTNIDYPVMQTVNNEYYLDHNYNQEYDKNGSIFLDKDCDAAFPNDNMIIYGHHMKSGKMFGNLNYYAKESYCKEHPYILFDTIYEEGKYQVMYVFRSQIYAEEDIVFKYYKFIDATSKEEFDSNMEEMKNISLYDTGVTAQYGDRLLTLSTCDSSQNNGRFVVVAKKIN